MSETEEKAFIMLVGLPASGKTTFFEKKIEEELFESVIRVSLDDFRKEIIGVDFFMPSEPFVRSWAEVTGRYLMSQGYDLAVDATSLTSGLRKRWTYMAKEYDYTTYCYMVLTPFDECVRRNDARERKVPFGVMRRMRDQLEMVDSSERFDHVFSVKPGKDGEFVMRDWLRS